MKFWQIVVLGFMALVAIDTTHGHPAGVKALNGFLFVGLPAFGFALSNWAMQERNEPELERIERGDDDAR